jgi:tRNA-splicing ligase RtcB
MWLADAMPHETATSLARLLSLPGLAQLAVMPDVHPSADTCVGVALATAGIVYPQAIGGDIGCGMATVRVGEASLDEGTCSDLFFAVRKSIDFVLARPSRRTPLPPSSSLPMTVRSLCRMPDATQLRAAELRKVAERDGVMQLGTMGRGNHFVEVQRDVEGGVWVMVHTGSRAMGQAIAGHYVRAAKNTGVRAALLGLDVSSSVGDGYLADQRWGVHYARANRTRLLVDAAQAVASCLGLTPDWQTLVDSPHNFVDEEVHAGASLLVHRKGAASAREGQLGLIPGSAGTFSVHVEGKGDARSLCSSSHGAGRLMSRSDAKRAVAVSDLLRSMRGVAFDTEQASRLRDESPTVYRDLRVVLEAQRELVRVVRRVHPVASIKASG